MNELCTGLRALCITLGLALAPGCVINSGDGEDDAGDDAAGDDGGSGGADDGAGDDGAGDDGAGDDGADDGAGDETGAAGDDGAGGGGPSTGAWLYEETGATTNACTFLDDPSNGFGEYLVESDGPGTFTILPGDDTEPFACTHDGASFQCDERLQEELMAGGTTLQVLVAVDGTLDSATAMSGTQDGRIVCEGSDCPTAEALLGTTFPCEFSVPFIGTKL